MNLFEFETNYTTEWIDKTGLWILLYPKGKGENKAAYQMKRPNENKYGGEYNYEMINGEVYLDIWDGSLLLSPTDNGFDLLEGTTLRYSFSRVI